jgi:hypothetical protein
LTDSVRWDTIAVPLATTKNGLPFKGTDLYNISTLCSPGETGVYTIVYVPSLLSFRGPGLRSPSGPVIFTSNEAPPVLISSPLLSMVCMIQIFLLPTSALSRPGPYTSHLDGAILSSSAATAEAASKEGEGEVEEVGVDDEDWGDGVDAEDRVDDAAASGVDIPDP